MKDTGYTGAEYLKEEMESRGMTSEIIWGPSAQVIQDNLRNGNVMLVSVGQASKFTSNSHIMAIVDINSDGEVYIINPSGTTENGWFNVSDVTIDCDYIVVTDSGGVGVAQSTTTTTDGYVAVVATWSQTDTTLESSDPNTEAYSTTQYSMTSTTVNYRGMVDRYAMPFDFLWALLVCGEEKEFVFELADLVYGSDIQVTIYDNLTVNTYIDTWNYQQECKKVVDIRIFGEYGDFHKYKLESNHMDEPTLSEVYEVKKTVITKTNTINQVLTKANTWIVDYTNEYEYQEPSTTGGSENILNLDDTEYPSTPDSENKDVEYSCEHTNEYKQEMIAAFQADVESRNSSTMQDNNINMEERNLEYFVPARVWFTEKSTVREYNRYINITETTTSSTETTKFIEGTPKVIEKTNSELDEEDMPIEINFVTIYKKAEHSEARKNINSIVEWLFEIVEENGKPDVDLVRYLLYKANGQSYGITEYDFSEYDASKFKEVSGIYGGTFEEKIWWAFIDAGYSKIATAGAMGNFYCESRIIACRVQNDYSTGYAVSQAYTEQVDSGVISRYEFINKGPRWRTVTV